MTYLVTTFDGDPDDGIAQVLDDDQTQDILADFLADPNVKNGTGLVIRKADYLGLSITDPDTAIAYINGTDDRDERRRRKSEVFHVIYGGTPRRLDNYAVQGSATGRMRITRPPQGDTP